MKKLLYLLLLCLTFTACSHHKKTHPTTYKTTDKPGYCYYDDGLWYIYYLNATTGNYYYYGTSASFNTYDKGNSSGGSADGWIPTADNVSNFSDMPSAVQAEATSMGESSGEAVGGSEAGNASDGSGMGESSGESSGGSDGGGDSGGGGDGGGGDGGGGD